MNWDDYFFKLINIVASKSKDRSVKIGCVVIEPAPGYGVKSTGYNGFPIGVNDNIDARHERPIKYLYTSHAEENAICNAARMGISLAGCVLYVQTYPCPNCARMIIQSGIKEVVIQKDFQNILFGMEGKINRETIIGKDSDMVMEMFNEAKVSLRIV